MAPMIGMMMSATSELTTAPNAAPMITATARSTTLPRIANFLNSSSIKSSPTRSTAPDRYRSAAKIQSLIGRVAPSLVDQPGVNHCLAHGSLRLLGRRHHGQAQSIGALTQQRQRILGRSGTRFDEKIDVQRREFVLQFQRDAIIAAQACRLELGAQPWRYVGGYRDAPIPAVGHE